MTKKHLIRAADIVRAILNGEWTNEPPEWPNMVEGTYLDWYMTIDDTDEDADYTRAVQTAEAFIMLFSAQNDRFDVDKFLVACGLQQKERR